MKYDFTSVIDRRGLDTKIEIDGRISPDNIRTFGTDVDLYVVGSTCVKRDRLTQDIRALNDLRQTILGGNAG